ncbi:unnamed protein product [Notodromas monacha]|uniref:Symplekin n=1 Tax=Notodromas monacha TaxID=399045 RepID=A0A7R9GBE3_9CRUS|nr:unnamed protein product [Notodromas monacha]CAG0914978.1 unnamed protein product [Notodromas monacha]
MSDLETENRVTELLNQTGLVHEGPKRIKIIAELKELLLHRAPDLFLKYSEEILAFQNDPAPDVRKMALGFFEEACQKKESFLRMVVPALQNIIFNDENPNVLKKAMQVACGLFKNGLKWVSTALPEEMKDAVGAWETLSTLRDYLVKQIDSDNDGIRTHAIKFMEAVILTLTHSPDGKAKASEICLDIVPLNLRAVRPRKLEEDAKRILESLLKFHSSLHISSVNLMATMAALTNIAKMRPVFLSTVVLAMQGLNSHLPPTLGKSQVSSVRKMMKVHMMALLKLPAAMDHITAITALLNELGATYQEIMKNHPNPEEIKQAARRKKDEGRKRPRPMDLDVVPSLDLDAAERKKRPKRDDLEVVGPKALPLIGETAVPKSGDLTKSAEEYISLRLRPDFVFKTTRFSTLQKIPDVGLDPDFPRLASNGLIRGISRLLGNQLVKDSVFPCDKVAIERRRREMKKAEEKRKLELAKEKREKVRQEVPKLAAKPVDAVVDDSTAEGLKSVAEKSAVAVKSTVAPISLAQKQKRLTNERLTEKSKPMSMSIVLKVKASALSRISSVGDETGIAIRSESRKESMRSAQSEVMAGLSSLMPIEDVLGWVVSFFLTDPVRRVDHVIAWLYSEYSQGQSYSPVSASALRPLTSNDTAEMDRKRYGTILTWILKAIAEKDEFPEKYDVIRRLFLETPSLTDEAVAMLSMMFPADEEQAEPQVIDNEADDQSPEIPRVKRVTRMCELLCDMILYRRGTGKHTTCLRMLLDLATHPTPTIRQEGLSAVMRLVSHSDDAFAAAIGEFAVMSINALVMPGAIDGGVKNEPQDEVPEEEEGGDKKPAFVNWSEDSVKSACGLLFVLLPRKTSYLFDLMRVFAETSPEVKRIILRLMEEPIKELDGNSDEVMAVLDNIPKGGETFVSRMILLLTEKAQPSEQLVYKVLDLYKTRVTDVRFLIPVVSGLPESELMEILPKFLRLAPNVLKEVFNRVLGVATLERPEEHNPSITPADLMVALHTIPPSAADVKSIIKATALCFEMKAVYTMEVMGEVIKKLVDLDEIPTLLMRTVIQAFSLYPKLSGHVLNALQHLIQKEVWKNPRVWEGFIKCCQRCGAPSCVVLMQLQAEQLKSVFKQAPDLKDYMSRHVDSFTENNAFVPEPVLEALFGQKTPRSLDRREPPPPGAMEAEAFAMHPATLMNMRPPIYAGQGLFDPYRG